MKSDFHQSLCCQTAGMVRTFSGLSSRSLLFISATKRPAEEEKEKVAWQVG